MESRESQGTSVPGTSVPGITGGLRCRSKHYENAGPESQITSDQVANHDEDKIDDAVEECITEAEAKRHEDNQGNLLHDVFNISGVLTDGASSIVDDSFLKCFRGAAKDAWNWNVYLYPAWCLGVVFRHFILFPLRAILLAIMLSFLFSALFTVQAWWPLGDRRREIELKIVQLVAASFVMSWTGVIKFHGPKPVPAPNRVWVANHTSMIDYGILLSYTPFAVIMQKHTGWVAWVQTRILGCVGCLWFNRTDINDRKIAEERMKAHIRDPTTRPLLIFPEGTCVNNEFCVMFKRGAFDLGSTVCPIAIKYNKIFVDAFWNSKKQTFFYHLLRLMFSWALVADIYFLEPQNKRDDETAVEFAGRVQKMIADTAGLRIVPWDGYLKYYNLGEKHPQLIEKRRKVFGDAMQRYLPTRDAVKEQKE